MHRLTDHSSLPIMGYAQALSVRPGARLGFHVSSALASLDAQVVRLDQPDAVLDWPVSFAPAPLQVQGFTLGSWLDVPLAGSAGWLSFDLMLTLASDPRTLFATEGVACVYGPDGRLTLAAGGRSVHVEATLPLNAWMAVRFEWTASHQCVRIEQGATRLVDLSCASMGAPVNGIRIATDWQCQGPTLDARVATIAGDAHDGGDGGDGGDGDVARAARSNHDARDTRDTRDTRHPSDRSLAPAHQPHIASHARDASHASPAGPSSWPLPIGYQQTASDIGGGRPALGIRGAPTWAVRGPAWTGEFHDPRSAPEHYAALHLHHDDKPAFEWPETHALSIPELAPSGVYALRLTGAGPSSDACADIFFVVLPARDASAPVFLLPTLTYQAYANEALPEALYPWLLEDPGHRAAQQNGWLSLYDCHADGSGVSLATWPCPWTTTREDYRYPLCGGPHGLPIDLHMLQFFARQGIAVEVITDHDLHRDPQLLAGRAGIITGSHPEYWTTAMLDGLDAYLDTGGHLAYLGGNGFYWVSALADDGTLEVRRGQRGVRTWESAPGENHLSMGGEPGGLWRWRGRPEHRLLGVGTAAMGFTRAQPYVRTSRSYDPAWAWVFEGIEGHSINGAGILLDGAAGYEIDRTSEYWGTPPDTVVLACASSFDASYELDTGELEPADGPRRRADLCIRHTPGGGWVFAAGSVCWGGALPAGGESNAVGRLTLNLLAAMRRSIVAR